MTKNRIKGIITIFSAFFMMLSLSISSRAFENDLFVLITPDENSYTASVYISSPERITDVDIKLFTDENRIIIAESSIENTDSEKFNISFDDFPESIDTNTNYFTFFNETASDKVSFSGFFVTDFSSNHNFHLLNIILMTNDNFSDTDTITIKYKINSEDKSKSGTITYFIKNGKTAYSSEAKHYPLGDVNADGKVSALDARTILRAAVGLEAIDLVSLPYANADYDEKISASDARYALRAAVGLEKIIYHSFCASPQENSSCEEGGKFTFTCSLTGKSFTMQSDTPHHIEENNGCYNTGKCISCNEKVFKKGEHIFNEYGFCSSCGANKNKISEAENALKPLVENISSYDFAASEALKARSYEDFISFTALATKEIKKAAEITKGINGLQTVHNNIEKAYSMRFEAIMLCTDENGKIKLTAASCSKIQEAVNNSEKFIDISSFENE